MLNENPFKSADLIKMAITDIVTTSYNNQVSMISKEIDAMIKKGNQSTVVDFGLDDDVKVYLEDAGYKVSRIQSSDYEKTVIRVRW